jgi:hypothetical protein
VSITTLVGRVNICRVPTLLPPLRVALAGLVVVTALLLLPIRTFAPGDHEKRSCGNALILDLTPWLDTGDGHYWQRAHRSCTTQRTDRIAQSVLVTSLTALGALMLAARRRRRDDQVS